MSSSLVASILGAVQASLSVLLTLSYGVVAAQLNLLSGTSTKELSSLCVKLLLPALLITNVGTELHLDTAWRYVPILSEMTMSEGFSLSASSDFLLSLVLGLCSCLLRPGIPSHTNLQASCLGYTGHLLQQHHIPSSAPGTILGCDRHPQGVTCVEG